MCRGGEVKRENHKLLLGSFSDPLGTALAEGKSCWLKRMRVLEDLWRSLALCLVGRLVVFP